MHAQRLIDSLERFGRVLPAVVDGLSPDDARWRPPNNAWSVLEVVRHLVDEEVEDFRRRLELTLRDPAAPWPAIDPEGVAVKRRYNEGSLDEAVERFVTERAASVSWLRGLRAPDWDRGHEHPRAGTIRAGDLLTAWAAHDALHLRQIAKRLFQMAERDGEGFRSLYAGSWTA